MGPALSIAAPILGGLLGGSNKPKETAIQKQQRLLIDQILQGVQGSGPYAHLFQTDDAAFQRSFVDPAMAMFRNQITPQIQQGFIADGQQRGSGLEDTLTRAGVDLEGMLASQYGDFQQSGINRILGALSGVMGAGPGFQEIKGQNPFLQSLQGVLGNPDAQDPIAQLLASFGRNKQNNQSSSPNINSAFGSGAMAGGRKGFQ